MGKQLQRWVFKQEPDCYSFGDLQRDGITIWDGVTNNLALKHLRNVAIGDRILFYHTGKEKAVVGEMTVIEGPMPDPQATDPKWVVVKVKPVKKWPRPVTLGEIKKDPQLQDWDLVKNSRLSVMPVSAEQWKRLVALSQAKP